MNDEENIKEQAVVIWRYYRRGVIPYAFAAFTIGVILASL